MKLFYLFASLTLVSFFISKPFYEEPSSKKIPKNSAEDFAKEMVDRHNFYRSELGIAPVEWSEELAQYAQTWADELASKCEFEHRPRSGKFKQLYGENIWMGWGTSPTAQAIVDSWGSEKEKFNFKTLECDGEWYECGHYTQVIWEGTKNIGCATATCKDGAVISVCNYDPAGNMMGQKPYTKKKK